MLAVHHSKRLGERSTAPPSPHAARPRYSHYSIKSVPVISTVDITGPKNAPQAPREWGMWTANAFMIGLLKVFYC